MEVEYHEQRVITMVRSYIKIYGTPILKALSDLEQIAMEMREKMMVNYFSSIIASYQSTKFASAVDLREQDDRQLVHYGAIALGDYDFFFEWESAPSTEQVTELIERLDAILADCGCRYTITTK
jgi:hypothetical protein